MNVLAHRKKQMPIIEKLFTLNIVEHTGGGIEREIRKREREKEKERERREEISRTEKEREEDKNERQRD